MLTAGIDVGSRTTKVVVLDNQNWIGEKIQKTGANSIKRAEEVFDLVLDELDLKKEDINYIIATGYGRVNISFADEKVTEITCHGLGAHKLFPGTKTIIDIGGQDSKVISLDDSGRVDDFIMNDKCAAGTGRFLEVMADNLEVPLENIGELSLKSNEPADISSTCTVFAESEVISLVAEGVKKSKILRGLHKAIVRKMIGMVHRVGLNKEITMTGGVCHNNGVYEILEKELGFKINRPSKPQYVGAYGAANLANIKLKKQN